MPASRTRTIPGMTTLGLYPLCAPLASHDIDVGHGHRMHAQEYGNPHGTPAVVLHGGPGSGTSPLLRRWLDPAHYRIVCHDQRGCGHSTPRGAISHNTLDHLLLDLRRLRGHLGIDRWLVVGGSWGATLAVAHAADDPSAIDGLLLRALFLARPQDVDAFFEPAAGQAPVPWRDLAAQPRAEQRRRALAWWRHEGARSQGDDGPAPLAGGEWPDPDDAAIDALVDRYRVQGHYLAHGCWLTERPLLERAAALPDVPVHLLHGDADRVCPPASARLFQQVVPRATVQWLPGAGHDPTHPAMSQAMRQALDNHARCGRFTAPAALPCSAAASP